MWTVLTVVAIVSVLMILAVRAALAGRPSRHEPQPTAVDPADADDFPRPGEPSPHRPDGRPIPGSRDDRSQKRAD
jgi:hypothetical protein